MTVPPVIHLNISSSVGNTLIVTDNTPELQSVVVSPAAPTILVTATPQPTLITASVAYPQVPTTLVVSQSSATELQTIIVEPPAPTQVVQISQNVTDYARFAPSASRAETASLAFAVDYTGVRNLPALVSSSEQVNYSEISGVPGDIFRTGTHSTSHITEGGKLFFTEQRVKDKLDTEGVISSSAQVQFPQLSNIPIDLFRFDSHNSSVIREGSNLFFTNDRVKILLDSLGVVSGSGQVHFTDLVGTPSDLFRTGSHTTTHIVEGDKPFYADWRVKAVLDALEVRSGSVQTTYNELIAVPVDIFHTGSHSTTDIREGNNLFYTDARVKTKLDVEGVISSSQQVASILETPGLVDFSDLASVPSDLFLTGSHSTTQITEGTKLFYTDDRVKNKLNTDSVVSSSAQIKNVLNSNAVVSSSAQIKTVIDTTGLVSSSKQVTYGDLAGLPSDVFRYGQETTTVITEGTKLFYTDERVQSVLNGRGVLSSSAQVQFPQVNGVPADIFYYLQNTTSDIIEGANLFYTDGRVKTKLNLDGVISSSNQVQYSGLSGTPVDIFRTGSHSTTNITEGTNLYFTDTRVKTKLDAENVVSSSAQVNFGGISGRPALVSSSAQVNYSGLSGIPVDIFHTGSHTTSNIVEGSNLFFTDARVKAKLNTEGVVSSSGQVSYDGLRNVPSDLFQTGSHSTTHITEGSNLFFTDARVKTNLNAEGVVSSSAQVNFAGLSGKPTLVSSSAQITYSGISGIPADIFRTGSHSTTNITEGTKLFYTDARVKAKLNADGVISSSGQFTLQAERVLPGAFTSGTYTFPTASVGMGVATPLATLHVSGNARVDGPATVGALTASSLSVGAVVSSTSVSASAFNESGVNLDQKYLQLTGGTINGSIVVSGSVTAQSFNTQIVSQSIIYQSGSTKFGDTMDDTMSITGSMEISGSITALAPIVGTLVGTASSAVSASIAATASAVAFENIIDKPTLVSSSAQVDFETIANKPTLVSSSAQVTYGGLSGVPSDIFHTASHSTSHITEGSKLFYTDGRVKSKLNTDGVISSSAQVTYGGLSGIPSDIFRYQTHTTSQIVEGTKLFYTDDRVKTKLNADGVVSSSAQVLFAGISGKPTLVSSSAQVLFAGISGKPTLVSSSAQIVYSGISGVPADLFRTGSHTTTAIVEGANLYYTDVRVKNKMNTDAVISSSAQVAYNQISGVPGDIFLTGSMSTTHITEGTKLFYTDERVKAKMDGDGVISSSAQVNYSGLDNVPGDIFLTGSHSTTNITEGTKLFFTDARVKSKLNTDGVISSSAQVNMSSVTTGTLNDARLSSNVMFKNGANVITGNQTFSGGITLDRTESWVPSIVFNRAGTFRGRINLEGTGSIADLMITAYNLNTSASSYLKLHADTSDISLWSSGSTALLVSGSAKRIGIYRNPSHTLDVHGNIGIQGTEVITSGRVLTNLTVPATLISGTVADGNLSSNVALRNHNNNFSVAQITERTVTSNWAWVSRMVGDAQPRMAIEAGGRLIWGDGSASWDTSLYRSAANSLATSGAFTVVGSLTAGSATVDGQLNITDGRISSTNASTSSWLIVGNVSGDTVGRFAVMNDGKMEWGAGGTTGRDVNLYRSAANTLKTDDSVIVSGTLHTYSQLSSFAPIYTETSGLFDLTLGGSAPNIRQIRLGTTYASTLGTRYSGADLWLSWNAHQNALAADSWAQSTTGTTIPSLGLRFVGTGMHLYYAPTGSTSGSLAAFWGAPIFSVDTRGLVTAYGINVNGVIGQYAGSAAGDIAYAARLGADTQHRFILRYSGALNWGPGGALGYDTNLYRSAEGKLQTDGQFVAAGWLTAQNGFTVANGAVVLPTGSVQDSALTSNVALKNGLNIFTQQMIYQGITGRTLGIRKSISGTSYTWEVSGDGTISWGDASGSMDTTLYRSAANILKTDDTFDISGELHLNNFEWHAPSSALNLKYSGSVDIFTVQALGGPISGGQLRLLQYSTGVNSATYPAFTFAQDTNTGVARWGEDDIALVTSGSARWRVTNVGTLLPVEHNTYDIGTATSGIRTVYAETGLYVGGTAVSLGSTYGAPTPQIQARVATGGASGSAGVAVYVNDGVYNHRAQLFTSYNGSGSVVWGLHNNYSSTGGDFVIRNGTKELRLENSTGNITMPGSWLIGQDTDGADVATKQFRLGVAHYSRSAEEPVAGIMINSTNTANHVYVGGGTGIMNAATQITFFTALNTTTTSGTGRWAINTPGHFLAISDNTYDIGASGLNRPRNVYVAGTVNAASLVETSTLRRKTDVADQTRQMNNVMKLRPVDFTWKDTGKRDKGLIAEEVAEVYPEFVAYEEVEGESVPAAVNYSKLVAVLIQTVQELNERVDKLEQEKKQGWWKSLKSKF